MDVGQISDNLDNNVDRGGNIKQNRKSWVEVDEIGSRGICVFFHQVESKGVFDGKGRGVGGGK